ncbi:hypothetical protein WN55_03262, partial [Dufourea novaeangliae]
LNKPFGDCWIDRSGRNKWPARELVDYRGRSLANKRDSPDETLAAGKAEGNIQKGNMALADGGIDRLTQSRHSRSMSLKEVRKQNPTCQEEADVEEKESYPQRETLELLGDDLMKDSALVPEFHSTLAESDWCLSLNCGFKTVEIASFLAAEQFNEGYSFVLQLMHKLDLVIGQQCKMFANVYDAQRLKRQERRSFSSNTLQGRNRMRSYLKSLRKRRQEDISAGRIDQNKKRRRIETIDGNNKTRQDLSTSITPTSNRFSILTSYIDIDMFDKQSPSKEPPPPPIYLDDVIDIQTLTGFPEKAINKEDYKLRINNDQVKILPADSNAYRKITNSLKSSL